MKTKNIFAALAILAILGTIVAAASVTTLLFYFSTTGDTLEINNGASETFSVSSFSAGESNMRTLVELVSVSGTSTLVDSGNSGSIFSTSYDLTPATYLVPGTYTIKSTVTGASSSSSVDTLALVVNMIPSITSTPVTTINEGIIYNYQIATTDDDATLTYAISGDTWLSISSSGLITGTAPGVSANTPFNIVVTVSDGLASTTQSFTINVLDVANSAPTITSTAVTSVNEGAAYNYQVVATDPDLGDVLTYIITQNPTIPAWLSINAASGLITGTAPNVAGNTPFTVTVTATDVLGSIATQVYIVNVADVDPNAPIVTIISPINKEYFTDINTLTYTAADPEGNLLNCWYSTNLGITTSTPVSCTGSFSINSTENINRWTVYASDTFGNVGSATVVFRVTTEDDSGTSNKDSKNIVYKYEDPDTSRYNSQSNTETSVPILNLESDRVRNPSLFAAFINSIIEFFKSIFGF